MEYFGHSNIVRKSIITFMDLFNDMYIEKYRADGSEQLFRVPIQFANREKYLQQLQSRVHHGSDHDGSVNKSLFELDMILPRMSVNILALSYDVQRKVGKQNKIFACEPCSLNELNHPFTNTPAPWNLELELSIISKNMDDGLQLLEQIVPYFQPSLSVNINFQEGYASDSVPIILDSVVPTMDEDLDDDTYRYFTWILNFRMKVNFHLPKKLKGRIKDIITNIHPNEKGDPADRFTQYQLAAEEFDVVHDSTSYYAMTFDSPDSGVDPADVTLRLWTDVSIPKLESDHGDTTYEWAQIRSDGGLEPLDGPHSEFILHDIDGGPVYWTVTFRYNVITVITTTETSVQQFIDIQETSTETPFRLAVQGGDLIVVPIP